MDHIALPSKITITEGTQPSEAMISIQPCHPGYGITLGNALRRVLLSSLPGAAVTSFKIKGAQHEFTTVAGVKEDIVELTLNLKQLRIKMHGNQPVKLTLKAKGEKVVKAKDITTTSDVEVVSPDAVIATLTGKDAELEMEITVEPGRGYQPVETVDKSALETGAIAVDAIFTPIRNVAFTTDNVRVGDKTNFENLQLTIETDASITPGEAFQQAVAMLLDHFNFILTNIEGTPEAAPVPEIAATEKEEAAADQPPEPEEKQDEKETEIAKEEKPKKRGRPKKSEAKESED